MKLILVFLSAVALFVFFERRRGHTRCSCDWSSDVCSSDLQELELKGVAIATSLAERSADPLVTENWWELHRLVNSAPKSDSDVLYAFVTDSEGRVVAHTFARGFPRQLEDANTLRRGASHQAQLLKTEKGLV